MHGSRHWVGVISRSHVLRGVAGGFTQVCHGKRAPLARMAPGDVFIAYSPKTDMVDGDPLRAFTAIGRVGHGPVVPFDMGNGFIPFRRDILWYRRTREVALDALRDPLAFVKDAGWGMLARRGHFEIQPADGLVIAAAMGVMEAPAQAPRQGLLAL